MNPSHIKVNNPNKHPGLEAGQQAMETAPEEQDKGTSVNKSALVELNLVPKV